MSIFSEKNKDISQNISLGVGASIQHLCQLMKLTYMAWHLFIYSQIRVTKIGGGEGWDLVAPEINKVESFGSPSTGKKEEWWWWMEV